MRIVVHDFTGYAFPVQLSRELARKGHDVMHLHFPAFECPKGALARKANDPATLQIDEVTIHREYRKYQLAKRFVAEWEYGRVLARKITDFCPQVVLASDTPLVVLGRLSAACRRNRIVLVPWVQDLYSLAIASALKRKWGRIGVALSTPFRFWETKIFKRCRPMIVISEGFRKILAEFGVPTDGVTVIENWAEASEVFPLDGVNAWRDRHGLRGRKVLLYSGTLGLKHNPELLLDLSRAFAEDRDVSVVVVSQGLGRAWLEERRATLNLQNLVLLDYQPCETLAQVLGAATILLAVIEADAARYSVPSKILSYFCAARPVLLAAPAHSHAARLVTEAQAGLTVEPSDVAGFVRAARSLSQNSEWAQRLGSNGRSYAENRFRIDRIAERFEQVLRQATASAAVAAFSGSSGSPDFVS